MLHEAFGIYIGFEYMGWAAFVILAPLTWVKNVQTFAATHLVADIFVLATMVCVIVYGFL